MENSGFWVFSQNVFSQLDCRIKNQLYLRKSLMNQLDFWYTGIDSRNLKGGLWHFSLFFLQDSWSQWTRCIISNWVNQPDFLHAHSFRKGKRWLQILWLDRVINTHDQSNCRIFKKRMTRSVSLIFCMLIEIQGRLISYFDLKQFGRVWP